MSLINTRNLSVSMGWLSIVIGIITIALGFYTIFCWSENCPYEWSDLDDVSHNVGAIVSAFCVCYVILRMALSIFLLKGIYQMRPKLMTAWIYVCFLEFITLFGFAASELGEYAMGDGIYYQDVEPYLLIFIFLLLQFWPVYMMYHKLQSRLLFVPTQSAVKGNAPVTVSIV